ncbi:NUDIX domain-containing protein [Actinomadura parmotrematis]|uniref:NUDIX domain-containing protein n=1 Tax=Actinomadura parmotrematis TaxID=2864039 RepID=A0ABS7G669_9ACTN|nr:NUDIX domain-containing protein [Actinomadura parmotrematis]MBW8487302.1 NUDIX domain-containing protein [Actinomadura parmotrematis]
MTQDPHHPQAQQTPRDQTPHGAVAIITNDCGELLLHLRDDIHGISWPGYWSVLGGGTDPGEDAAQTIRRELWEEAGLAADNLRELFEVHDRDGSGQLITFFAGTWNGDETTLPLAEGVKLAFTAPEALEGLKIPPYIRAGIERYLHREDVDE